MKKMMLGMLCKWLVWTAMLNLGIWLIFIGFLSIDKGCDIVMFKDYYIGMSGAWFFLAGGKFVFIGTAVLIFLWFSRKIDW